MNSFGRRDIAAADFVCGAQKIAFTGSPSAMAPA